MKKVLSLLFISIFIILFSCNEESPTTPEESDGDNIFENSATIGTSGGKVLVSDDSSPIKGSFVDIPEGALTDSKTIIITPSDTEVPDPNAIVIKLEPEGLNFSKPVKIGLPFN